MRRVAMGREPRVVAGVEPRVVEDRRDASGPATTTRGVELEPTRSGSSLLACSWCGGDVPGRTRGGRRDGELPFCCPGHRWAHYRFRVAVRQAVGGLPVLRGDRPARLVVMDPPYPDKAYLYRGHKDFGGEVDHAALLRSTAGFDGWALSTSADALSDVIGLAREAGIPHRVASWTHGERRVRSGWPLAAWDPVLYWPARPGIVTADQVPDALKAVPRPRTSDPNNVIGAKPAEWCVWVFGLLQAQRQDDLVDSFPGSGGVTRAWDIWRES